MYFLRNPRSIAVNQPTVKQPAVSEFIYENASFPSCHASTIVETHDGTLVAAWFGGTAEQNPNVGIWLSRKIDGKWSEPIEVVNGLKHLDGLKHLGLSGNIARYPTWNPVLFQPQLAGKKLPLMLFYKVGPTPETWWGMLVTSDDDGKSWSEPARLPDGILGPVRNKPVQLADGSILSPSSVEIPGKLGQWQVHFEKSSDLGITWRKIGPIHDGIAVQAIQPTLIHLGNDRWSALLRTRQGLIYQTDSRDAGESWRELYALKLPNNNSGMGAVMLRDGSHALVYNHIGGTPGKWGGIRTPLNLSTSRDGEN